jgi:RNA polymerase sigma-70 factor, ECF subfamily
MLSSSNDITEKQWLAALAAGEEGALRRIFNLHYPLLLNDLRRLLTDEDACKDIAQEVFLELWKKRASLDIHTSLRAYLKRAAINKALNFLKSNKRFIFEDSDAISEEAVDMAAVQQEESQKNDLELGLHAAIDTLPEKCRLVFSLSRFENMSHKEIADQLGISVKTIENQITKAMKMLREYMIRHHDLSRMIILGLIYNASA